MNRVTVFNPEHDLALANGDKHFIAPKNIREMAKDLTPLLEVMDDEDIMVWGWDHAIKSHLLRMGIASDMLPTDEALTKLRTCSERQSAHHLLRAFHADHPDGPYTGESILAHSIDDIAAYATQHGHIILKDPLSSSGKGLRHVNINEGGLPLPCPQAELLWEDKSSVVATDAHLASAQRGGTEGMSSLSSSLSKVENWANALIKRHGYLTAEPFYDKAQDFAMEFCIRDGQCHFIGYSLFNTNHHGRYESNLLMADEKIENLLAQYVPHSALHEVRDWVIAHNNHFIPTEWNTTKHPLYFGIDMMVVMTTDNGQQTTDNGQHTRSFFPPASELRFVPVNEMQAHLRFLSEHNRSSTTELLTDNSQHSTLNPQLKLHPCVEINLRLNMGIIAHEVYRKLLVPGTEGTFHVTAFPTDEAAHQFHQEHTTKHPPVCRDGKILSGYHPLTSIHSHTHHHAYVICR